MSFDKLSLYSKQNFNYLEEGELRIINLIAKSGPLNLSELGKYTSKYTMGFDRWGVSKRLEGSTKFRGLIKQDYIAKLIINKKETRYGLTVKGLLAALRFYRFDKIYLVGEYLRFLQKYTQDTTKLKLLFSYIKYEIAFLLCHNCIQGVDWTRFRYTKSYLNTRRKKLSYPDSFLDLEIEPYYWIDQENKIFDSILTKYLDTYSSYFDSVPLIKSQEVYDKLVKGKSTQRTRSETLEIVVLNMAAMRWYQYIDSFELKNTILDMVEDYIQIYAENPNQYWPKAIRGNEEKSRILGSSG
jgi:hypothetical protein